MTRHSRVTIAIVVVGVGLLMLAPSPAAAAKNRKRIAVLEIEGARNPSLQRSVARVVKRKHRVLTDREYARAARRLRARKMNPRSVARVAERIEADGVIQGMLVAEEDHYVLRLRLREGTSGKTVRKFSVYLRSPELNGKLRAQLADKLYAAIDNLEPMPAPEPNFPDEDEERGEDEFEQGWVEEEVEEEPVDDEEAWQDEELDEEERPSRRRRAMRERDLEDMPPADDDAPMREAAADDMTEDSRRDKTGRSPSIELAGGVSVVARTLEFTSRAYDEAPLPYEGAPAPSAFINGAFYPMVNSEGVLSKVGLGFVYEQAVGMESNVTAGEMVIPLPTERTRYGFNARYRHNFGDKATSPSVILSAGYNKLSFALDRTPLPETVVIDTPDVEYTYFDPGLLIRFPTSPKLALLAEGKGLLVTEAGDIATPEQYGTATIIGFDADVAVEYRATKKIVVRLGGHITSIGFDFEGNGEQAINRDGDPMSIDVGGALDQTIGGYITAGYSY